MGKKKVDPRIKTLIENGVKMNHRTMFIIVGDNSHDQVVNLHYVLSKSVVRSRPTVLWCYKKDLGFTTHKKKRIKQIKKQIQRGIREADAEDPFELFISSTDIRYTYYKDSHKILGNTYGMLVLQDFEALTPNLLARTIETVEGGGLILFLIKNLKSLKQLYTLTMDVHSRFRTESHKHVVGRFNERFILSLGSCQNCIVVDDQLNILPISSHMQNITPISTQETNDPNEKELKDLKASMKDTDIVGDLLTITRTLDQAKAVLTFVEAISEKTLRSTVTLTAARGRGKSAALGLAIVSAIAFGYSNIFVTSPSPENLKTLFEFIFKGFDKLSYKEHLDYELVESTNPEFKKAIVRVNVFKSHRQTIQYIQPTDFEKLSQAELVVIDEAAAIPLPLVKKMFGPHLVFMASTINGYEGTGRSLSLKLVSQLRQQSTGNSGASGRVLREIEMKESIRYSSGDPIEVWLYSLLCLDSTSIPRSISTGYPHPNDCELYYINRDTLFSYHSDSEVFLQRLVGLFVSSHYKNSPDDLLLMSDAPTHHLFVLLGPVKDKKNLPDILCAVQISHEGQISKDLVVNSLSQGRSPQGDLIPWTISQQFQDSDFPSLSGARVVRIATNPEYQRLGYGSKALDLLAKYYQGEITSLSEKETDEKEKFENSPKIEKETQLLTEKIEPRENLPPLLTKLKDRKAERLHYMGVSYGVTSSLFSFWKKCGYIPVYLRQTPNDLTGEHTCIMFKPLKTNDLELTCKPDWIKLFAVDFKKRFLSLLGYSFRSLPTSLALNISKSIESEETVSLSKTDLDQIFSPYDLKRLDSYARNLIDYHVMMDLMPTLSRLYFTDRLNIPLSAGQAAIFLAIGLQYKSVEEIEQELTLPVNQILALFNKSIRKVNQYFHSILEQAVSKSMPSSKQIELTPLKKDLDEELEEIGNEVKSQYKRHSDEMEEINQLVNMNQKIPNILSIEKKQPPEKKQKHSEKDQERKKKDKKKKRK